MSFKSLVNKLVKEGKSREAATKIAGKVANAKMKGAGSGPTAKQKARMKKGSPAKMEDKPKRKVTKSKETLSLGKTTGDVVFKGKTVTRPSYWVGFKVTPKLIEFWQQMPSRLHDRLEYKKVNQEWKIRKLFP